MMVKGDDGLSIFLDWVIYYKNEQDPFFQEKMKNLWVLKWKNNDLPRVRLELTAFRLWDWRAAYCATEAIEESGRRESSESLIVK